MGFWFRLWIYRGWNSYPFATNGNPKPRMFRINEYESIINRMGFNNNGLNALVDTMKKLRNNRLNIPIGINIGKNKNTPT